MAQPPDYEELAKRFGGRRVDESMPQTPTESPSRTWMESAREALPSVGGFVGGLVGGIPGAGLGGMAGAGYRQLVQHAGELPGAVVDVARHLMDQPRATAQGFVRGMQEGAQRATREGVMQAATEAGGRAMMAVAKTVGRGLVEQAVRPTITLSQRFPEGQILDTIVKEKIPVGALPGLTAGSAKASMKRKQAIDAVFAKLEDAEQQGWRFQAAELVKSAKQVFQDLKDAPLGDVEERKLYGMVHEFLSRHPGDLTPVAVKRLKDAAHAIAEPLYAARARGLPLTAKQTVRARFHSDVARGAKEALELIPGIHEAETAAQGLKGASLAIRRAELRRRSLTGEGLALAAPILTQMLQPSDRSLPEQLRNDVLAYLVTRGLTSPTMISRGGLALTARSTAEVLKQFPRVAEYVLRDQPAAESESSAPDR